MNPFLDSQAQRNTPRGCGFAGACQKLSLLPRKQSKLNQRSQPGRPTRWRRRIRSSRGRNRNGLKNGFRVVGCGVAALVEPHTAPIAARSSRKSFLYSASATRHDCRASAAAAGQPKQHSLLPPRATTAPATCGALAQKPHSLPPRNCTCAYCRARVRQPPPPALAAPHPWPPRQSAGARAHLLLMTSTN